MIKKKRNIFSKILIILGSTLLFLISMLGSTLLAAAISKASSNTDPKQTKPTDSGLVFARYRSLYDKDGKILRLRGVNLGGLLNTEGWMAPYSCGTESSGSYWWYPTLSEDEARQGLKDNPHLNDTQRETIMSTFRDNWVSDDDYRIMKEVYNFNAIRLPIYWEDLMVKNGDAFSLRDETTAFSYLDHIMEQCQLNGLYCILDLHAAPITQSGYEHSGHTTWNKQDLLWYNENGIKATCDLWEFIANHYTYTKPELGQVIATYDLLNEPSTSRTKELWEEDLRYTTEDCYPVFDRIYKAIRKTGDQHVITMNFVWTYWQLPNPYMYGWQNIQYELHFYNDIRDQFTWDTMMYGFECTRFFHDYELPIYIGEFNAYGNMDDWIYLFDYFERRGYSWTFWTYKIAVTGNWTSNWGLYNYKLGLSGNQKKVNLKTDNYTKIMQMCEESNTSNCDTSTCAETIRQYMQKYKEA